MTDFAWSVRVRTEFDSKTTIFADDHRITIGHTLAPPGSKFPPGISFVLGALGSEIVNTFRTLASASRVDVFDAEARVEVKVSNPLASLGVVGEIGPSRVESIHVVVAISADRPAANLACLAEEAEARSVLLSLLKSGTEIVIHWRYL